METIAHNVEGYSKRKIMKMKTAQEKYYKVGFPSVKYLKIVTWGGNLSNFSITEVNIEHGEHIYGPIIYELKGKTVRHKPEPEKIDYVYEL